MALLKTIKKPNGVTLSYHRIAMVKIDVNQQITILVESYIDEDGRNYEKAYDAGEIKGEPVFPYTESEYISTDYDETMSIKSAYEWLKQQTGFVGSEDI